MATSYGNGSFLEKLPCCLPGTVPLYLPTRRAWQLASLGSEPLLSPSQLFWEAHVPGAGERGWPGFYVRRWPWAPLSQHLLWTGCCLPSPPRPQELYVEALSPSPRASMLRSLGLDEAPRGDWGPRGRLKGAGAPCVCHRRTQENAPSANRGELSLEPTLLAPWWRPPAFRSVGICPLSQPPVGGILSRSLSR